MISNEEIAATLEELAGLLQARGELVFRTRSYRKAAEAIRELGVPLEEYRQLHDLKEIPGVGDAIAKKVAGMIEQGPRHWLDEYMERKYPVT